MLHYETVLFACFVVICVKKLLMEKLLKIFQRRTLNTKTTSVCDACKVKHVEKNDMLQHYESFDNHNYQLQLRYENGKATDLKTMSQRYFERENRPLSFGSSVGLKYSFCEGNKDSMAVNLEMRQFANEILRLTTATPPLFDEWYHRKSGSIVLAVCQWKKPSAKNTRKSDQCDQFFYTRGINVEVSLATGSICAERVAISTAHTAFPDLTGKNNLSAVAVLDLSIDVKKRGDRNPLLPCAMCQIWLEKLASSEIRVIAYPDIDFSHYIEFYRPWSIK